MDPLRTLKTAARQLKKAFDAGNQNAIDRATKVLGQLHELPLQRAQHVIAVEDGFLSWGEMHKARNTKLTPRENRFEPLALELGLTVEELSELHWEQFPNESSDGMLYEWVIEFDEDSPQAILDKINGLDRRSVIVSPQAFEGGSDG